MLKTLLIYQVQLRKETLQNYIYQDNDSDLYQWYNGSKLCTISLESLITLSEDNDIQYIEIKLRGPRETSQYCFYFFEQIIETVTLAIYKVCPGLLIERHILSSQQLRVHDNEPYCFHPDILMAAILESESTLDVTLYNPETGKHETISQLLLFDNTDLAGNIQWGCILEVSDLPAPVKLKLCGLLDPQDHHGRDWCLLALKLGLNQEKIATLDSQHSSHTMRLLTIADCTIGVLILNLNELERNDAAEVVLRSTPLLKIVEPISF